MPSSSGQQNLAAMRERDDPDDEEVADRADQKPLRACRHARVFPRRLFRRFGTRSFGHLLAPAMWIEAPNEIDDVSYVFLRQAVVDPGRHRRALHAVQDRLQQPPVGRVVYEPGVPQIARAGKDVERVRALAVRLAAVASGAALQEDLLAVRRPMSSLTATGFVLRHVARLELACRLLGEGRQHVSQHAFGLLVLHDLRPTAASTFPPRLPRSTSTNRSRGLEFMKAALVKSRGDGSRYQATLPFPSPFSPWQRSHSAL